MATSLDAIETTGPGFHATTKEAFDTASTLGGHFLAMHILGSSGFFRDHDNFSFFATRGGVRDSGGALLFFFFFIEMDMNRRRRICGHRIIYLFFAFSDNDL
jgi:hypothetical protein